MIRDQIKDTNDRKEQHSQPDYDLSRPLSQLKLFQMSGQFEMWGYAFYAVKLKCPFLQVGVSLSAARVNVTHHPNAHFKRMPLSAGFAGLIPKGISFASRNTIPRFCLGSKLCQLLQQVCGAGSKFTTSASGNQEEFKLAVEFESQQTAPVHRIEMNFKVGSADECGTSY